MSIFFVDIDGTILDCAKGILEPTNKTKEAFKLLKENGHYVFIASGRLECLLPESVINLKPSGFVLGNGAYAVLDDKVLIDKRMSEDMVKRILKYTNSINAVSYLEANDKMYINDINNPINEKFADGWDIKRNMTDEAISDYTQFYMAMIAVHNEEEMDMTHKALDEYFDVRRHMYGYSFDINQKAMSKGDAITELLNILNIDKSDSYAFGDGLNDIEMMQAVGHSVAMGNAFKELKEVSLEETLNVEDDGFYHYLKTNKII